MSNIIGRGHIFEDPKKIEEMLNLRMMGYSYVQIARRYDVDHSTIIYHCQKNRMSLRSETKKELYDLIKQNATIEEISKKLIIPLETINLYLSIYGLDGKKIYSRRFTRVGRLKKKLKPKKIIKIKDIKEYKIEDVPCSKLTITDKRGVIWFINNRGERICMGKTEETIKKEVEEKKKKQLELKRLKMLKY